MDIVLSSSFFWSSWELNLLLELGMNRISGSVCIRYPVKFGHFSAIRYPAGYRILKNRISGFRISGRISGKPDIYQTFFLILEDLRCFNSLSNSVGRTTNRHLRWSDTHALNFIDLQGHYRSVLSHVRSLFFCQVIKFKHNSSGLQIFIQFLRTYSLLFLLQPNV